MKQGYVIAFVKPGLPKFSFEDPPYTFAWVKDFAAGISSAVRKEFELPEEHSSDARIRGERMGTQLKLFASRWGLVESDFRAITITWIKIDGTKSSRFYEKLKMTPGGLDESKK